MDREKLILIQLKEANKFAKSTKIELNRIAIILIDNIIELSLTFLLKSKFYSDPDFEKYSIEYRKKALSFHDKLLKVCKDLKLINEDEFYQIRFCHDVRNKLYHKSHDEKIIIKISLTILYNLIQKKFRDWNGWLQIAFYDSDTYDNIKSFYSSQIYSRERSVSIRNTSKYWEEIIEEIDQIGSTQKNAQELFCNHIKLIIRNINANIKSLKNVYNEKFETSEDFSLHSFSIFKKDEIDKLIERKKEINLNDELDQLFEIHKNSISHIKKDKINKIIKKLPELKLEKNISKAIQKYQEIYTKLIKYDLTYEEWRRYFSLEVYRLMKN